MAHADLAARVRDLENGTIAPAEPRHAATVVLLRDGVDGVEAYLLRRVAGMAFGAGMHVFPGGSVDPDDAREDIGWAGPPPTDWATRLTADEPLARALVCAAVRETFEESGVLLAGRSPDDVIEDVSGDEWEAERVALESRDHSLGELLTRRSLVLRADLLHAWSHYITPVIEPKRFDTRFFVAALPTGQRPRAVGGEADRRLWLNAAAAVERHHAGDLAMLPPTLITLQEVAEHATVSDVLASAAGREIRPVLPRLVVRDEQVLLLRPGDEGYDAQ